MIDPEDSLPGLATAASLLPEDAQGKVIADAAELTSTAKEAVESVKVEAVNQFGNLKEQAQSQFSDATEKAKSFAGEQKDAAGDQLSGVADAISKVANELQDQPAIAGYANELAGGIKRVSETVKNRNVDELLAMAEDFGRTQPVAFLGAAALAGFVASRFVLSSANRRKAASDNVPRPSTINASDNVGQSNPGAAWSPNRQGGV